MKRLFKVAQQFRTTSEVIKKMIDNGEISYELRGGIYYVDESEVKSKLDISKCGSPKLKFVELDKEMKFIIKETITDLNAFISTSNVVKSYNAQKNVNLLKKVLKDGYISKFEILEELIEYYSKNLLALYNKSPNEFLKFFNIKTPFEFYNLRNEYRSKKCNILSICLEHFYMFNKLCNGNTQIVTLTSLRLEEIKNRHFA